MRRGTTTQRAVSGLVAVGLVVGLAGGLAGCTNDPEPSHLPTPTEAVTPSPTPTPAPDASAQPEWPVAASQVGTAGAEAFAVYFLQLYPYVYSSHDYAEWAQLSHPDCVFCASVVSNVDRQVAAGHTNTGSAMTIRAAAATEISAGSRYAVEVRITEGPSVERDADGAVVSERVEPEDAVLTFALVHDGGWLVREVDASQDEDAP
jgi:hypothetical protein